MAKRYMRQQGWIAANMAAKVQVSLKGKVETNKQEKDSNYFMLPLPTQTIVDSRPLRSEPVVTSAKEQKCPWCSWTGKEGELLSNHIQNCPANVESQEGDECDDGNWFMPDNSAEKIWHLPDMMGNMGSACQTVPLYTPYKEVCTLSMPTSEKICHECLARHPDRWVHWNGQNLEK